jgi:hypothetical protein
MIVDFYKEADRCQGYIMEKNRQGNITKYPLMSLSIVGVDLSAHHYLHYFQVIDTCSALKRKAKKLESSVYVKDMKKD